VPVEIKTVGNSGEISLGKKYAGRTVIVEEVESGVWMIRTARVIPDNELWLRAPEARESLEEALEWSARNPRGKTDLKSLTRRIRKFK
jgi:hypothetical protein